jgi:hypothetical protein
MILLEKKTFTPMQHHEAHAALFSSSAAESKQLNKSMDQELIICWWFRAEKVACSWLIKLPPTSNHTDEANRLEFNNVSCVGPLKWSGR